MSTKRTQLSFVVPANRWQLITFAVIALFLVTLNVHLLSLKISYEDLNEKILSKYGLSYTIQERVQLYSPLYICGRRLPFFETSPKTNMMESKPLINKIVVIGHDTMNHVQTNNHINAIFHAVDYSNDIGAYLVIFRNSWAERSLITLFGDSSLGFALEVWGIFMIHDMSELVHRFPKDHYQVLFNKSDDMYYYHTSTSIHSKQERRNTMLRYLWSHPSRGKN